MALRVPPGPPVLWNRDISDETLIGIGKSVVNWNRLEQALEEAIWKALGYTQWDVSDPFATPFGAYITMRMGFREKVETIRSLCKAALDEDGAREVSAVLKEVGDLSRDRNIIVHGNWYGSGNPEYEYQSAFNSRQREYVTYEITPKALEQHSHSIEQVIPRVIELGGRLENSHGSWQKKYQQQSQT